MLKFRYCFVILSLCITLAISNSSFALPRSTSIPAIKSAYKHKNYTETISLCQQYIKDFPRDPDAWLFLGYANYQLKNYLAAQTSLQHALKLDPNYIEVWAALSQTYYAQSDFQQALSVVNEGLTHKPKSETLLLKKSQIYYALNQLPAAIGNTELILQINPKNILAQNLLAKLQAEAAKNATAPKTATQVATAIPEETPQPATSPITTEQLPVQEEVPLPVPAKFQINIDIKSIQALLANNNLTQAEYDAKKYLSVYPTDLDAQFLLGLIYQREQQWELAKNQFIRVLKLDPTYPEVRISLINSLFALHDYTGVIQVATADLNNANDHAVMLYYIASAQASMNNYQQALATIESIPDYIHNEKAYSLYNQINAATNYKYQSYVQVGLNSSIIGVQNPNEVWTLSSVYAQYNTPKGSIGLQTSYQTRPGFDAPQYQIFANPQLSDSNYASLAYAYANNPTLFPDQYVYGEDFQTLPYSFIISAGNTYRKTAASYLNAYTGSLGKYFGNYYLQLRPTYYVPKSGPTSLLYTLTAQKYFSAREYVGFTISEGTAPDLADLNTSSFIKTDLQVYMLSCQHEINKQFAMQYGIGEMVENFGDGNLRNYTYFNFGLSFRDV
jgi:YaiO family outer membrane protein